jgi:hypothetical protein
VWAEENPRPQAKDGKDVPVGSIVHAPARAVLLGIDAPLRHSFSQISAV